ncbi:P-loop containing nucleoside triphosphate hydrolase protein [Rhodofomes roseus]|uniref:P-loop containing nucleoside triphosphate hydrolase protein n=1 Tax=Rhodofomes roseus TaxID=34475 RepID=A0ABQ8KXS8_9APHY|nr:P-loop containing nucleoside triphosphate hydrolase protein [Rhodofomes roseus]KAH9844113.1 P-loop containing nucleoside triphosphate hydrolase protein [Rhodofomes roseus]
MQRGRSSLDFDDAFVNVMFEEGVRASQSSDSNSTDPFYDVWIDQASAPFAEQVAYATRTLRKLYPTHTVVPYTEGAVNIMGFPGTLVQPMQPSELVTSVLFQPLSRRSGQRSGVLYDSVYFGAFRVAYDKYDFLLYTIRYPVSFGSTVQNFLLHAGPEEHSRALIMAAGIWHNQLHQEIYVFNQGYWRKDHNLWIEVQKANWDDVILKQEFKDRLQKDVNGFFESETLYKNLAIPWKRGLIMYGPPGNGKTISMKAIMKECDAKGYAPLYVKSFKSFMGEEGSMALVFDKAREMAPCVLILEDLDSLINDSNRSFFLNQLDGLEGNDGLLLIGSTNHFDKLDPALSGRPSRFDRKWEFEDPDEEERALYTKYWQDKLKSNKDIDFPDSLVHEIAATTNKFSFAYLKEAFVSTLVIMAGFEEGDKPDFASVLKGQVKTLRDQLDKDSKTFSPVSTSSMTSGVSAVRIGQPSRGLDAFRSRLPGAGGRIWDTSDSSTRMAMPGGMPPQHNQGSGVNAGDVRPVAMGGRSFIF